MESLLLITTSCPIECDHCQHTCTAQGEWMDEKTLKKTMVEFHKNDIDLTKISGGEPFLFFNKLLKAIDIISEYYNPNNIAIATSGFWANNKKETYDKLQRVKERGIQTLQVSVDRFHLKKVPLRNIENILKISKDVGMNITLRPLFDIKSKNIVEDIAKLVKEYKPQVIFSVTDAIGRGEKFEAELVGRNKMLDLFISMVEEDYE